MPPISQSLEVVKINGTLSRRLTSGGKELFPWHECWVELAVMKVISHHIRFLSRAAVVLVVLASSGFTGILHSCSLESMSCCGSESSKNADDCNNASPLKSQQRVESILSCHTNTVVGGLVLTQAVVEKQAKIEQKQTEAPVIVFTFSDFCNEETRSSFTRLLSTGFPSVSVDKCVLNASFLI